MYASQINHGLQHQTFTGAQTGIQLDTVKAGKKRLPNVLKDSPNFHYHIHAKNENLSQLFDNFFIEQNSSKSFNQLLQK